jgi:hypothetical protein
MGNIKAEKAYDPFPKTGLVKQYEPFIRTWVADFCQQFPWVNHGDVLVEAVLQADKAAKRFKPELGHDFSTLCGLYLKKLYAMQEEEKGWSHAAPTDWAQEQEKAPQILFPGGANGTRLAFDRWKFANNDKRKGIVIGMRLNGSSESHARGVNERISAALDVLQSYDDQPGALGRIRAAVDHLERRQREEEQEAEDRRFGIYAPTFLEVRPVDLHMQRYEAKTPRHSNVFPDHDKVAKRDRVEEGWQNSLGTILHPKNSSRLSPLKSRGLSGDEIDSAQTRFEDIVGPVLRPRLSPDERAVWDWIGAQMFGDGPCLSAEQLADQLGLSKRTIYKIRDRVILKLKKELSGDRPRQFSDWVNEREPAEFVFKK